jgi:hypothetical protein
VRIVGAEFDELDDPSEAHDFDHGEHEVHIDDELEFDVDLLHGWLRVGADGDGDPPRRGVPDDLGRDHDHGRAAGVRLGQRPCVGSAAGKPGRLQRRDRGVDAHRPDGRVDLHRQLRG